MTLATIRATMVGTVCCMAVICSAFPGAAQMRTLPSSESGITVVGHAVLNVPPDRLRIVVRLFERAGPGDHLEAAAGSVAGAMKSAGIVDAKVALPVLGMLSSNSTLAVVGTIAKPTRDSLEAALRATVRAIPPDAAAQIGTNFSVQTTMLVDDCSVYDAKLQAAVLADARARARSAASAAGVALGPITAINESGAFAAPGCGPAGSVLGPALGEDAYGPIALQLVLNATVTFALR